MRGVDSYIDPVVNFGISSLALRAMPKSTTELTILTKFGSFKPVALRGFLIELYMAKTSVIARSLKKPKFSTRIVRRCFKCGRGRAYMGDFALCRICFRELANEGRIPGVKKSSW